MRPSGWLQDYVRVHESQLQPNEVPKAYQTLTVEGIAHSPFQEVVKTYLKDFWTLAEAGKAPAFLGRAGAGKTFSAAVIANSVRRALIDVAFVQCAVELPELERRRFDPWVNTRINYLGTCPFVVMDDITKARPDSIALDTLDAIVERRYADGLPTVFTGNVIISAADDSALSQQFGAGLARRIREMSRGLTKVSR